MREFGPDVLSVHAVDTVGKIGVLPDAAVCAELRCRPVGVVTSVVATRAGGVDSLQSLSLSLVAQEFESVMGTCRPRAVRTGVLTGPRQVELVSELIKDYDLPAPVVAPVLRIGSTRILSEETLQASREFLYPLARVVVARAGELRLLVGRDVRNSKEMKEAASMLRSQGARAVLITGAVWRGQVLDLLDEEGRVSIFDTSRTVLPRTGARSGAHAAAVASLLARGQPLVRAVEAAQRHMSFRLQRAG